MHMRFSLCLLPLLAVLAFSISPADAFERQKFDRSRFERPDPSARPPLPSTAAAPVEPAEPVAPAAPMVTTAPGNEFSKPDPAGYTFSSNPPAHSPTPTAASPASTNTAIFSADAVLAPRPPGTGGPTYPAGATPEEKAAIDAPLFDQLPSKDFNNAKDHDELVALQKKTGACMIVYFKNFAVPNEKGLCSWFEKRVTTDIKWRRAMKYYLQLTINVPGTSAVEELTTKYRAGKTPALFVVKPGSTIGTRIKLFDYAAGSRPEPIAAEQVVESLKAASTPAYQTLF
jgi:hypothetical protein